MNERIRLLKHQASLWCDENIPEQFSEETNSYGRAWEDKFAELIVRECASKITRNEALNIFEHFGVKE
jgi:hypothetical protein